MCQVPSRFNAQHPRADAHGGEAVRVFGVRQNLHTELQLAATHTDTHRYHTASFFAVVYVDTAWQVRAPSL
jgi:hypothetical protein